MVPSDPPGVLRVPILGPNRGMFSKLNGPSPLGSGGHSYTSFSIGRFYAQWNSFGGDVASFKVTISCFPPEDSKDDLILKRLYCKPNTIISSFAIGKLSQSIG